MSISMKRYNDTIITPKDDRILFDQIFDDYGLIYGGSATMAASNKIHVGAARGFIKGTEVIVEAEDIAVNLSDSGTKNGRLKSFMDLADTETPIKFESEVAASFPALEQDANINYDNGRYEVVFATYKATETTISSVALVMPTMQSVKAKIQGINQSLTNLNDSKKTYLRLVLPNLAADAKTVCDYINKNYLLGQLSPAYTVEFDVVASNADWFSGTLSTDLLTLAQGRTVWGFVQQRTSSAENSTLYKYFAAGTGGAGSVRVIDETIADPMFCESIPGRNQITDFLNVNLSNRNSDINKIHYFGSDNPATAFTNSPYTAGPFYGYRVVRWCSESANTYHLVTVELHEQYPVSGRVWSNTYDINNGTWCGWKCNQGNTFIDVGTVLKNVTTIAAGATVTYVATRDCFVNVAAYAHGSGQNTKIYIDNVHVFNPYTNNGDNAGLVIVDKTVPLKTGQTIKIENGTYTTSSYAIFAAF